MGGSAGGFVENVTGINMGNDSASDQAIAAQRDATRSANATQKYIFDTQRKDAEPWRDAGVRALTGLEDADFKRDFTVGDFQQDPGYQFRMAEGMKALERSAAARGGLNSGRTMKELTRYGQDFASNEYSNAYNRFNADRDRRFNRLSSLAGLGQTANTQIGQAGQNYANQYGQNVMGMANAEGAAHIAQANRFNQVLGQGAQAYMMSDQRVKTHVAEVSKEDISELRRHLKPYTYQYKLKEFGEGEFLGVMAQDLEKSKLGRTLISEDENGFKRIDLTKAVGVLLAVVAEG